MVGGGLTFWAELQAASISDRMNNLPTPKGEKAIVLLSYVLAGSMKASHARKTSPQS